MKNFFVLLCLAVVFQGCVSSSYLNCPRPPTATFVLISDVDDTVKVTNVPSSLAKLKNGLWGRLMFAGMPELYRGLLNHGAVGSLEFVSGAPTLLRKVVTKRLNGAGFSYCQLALRSNLMRSVGRFKSEYLNSMYGSPSNLRFILIGDDTEEDPEVYRDFEREHKDSTIYIHRITGRSFDSGCSDTRVFTTAYDVALYENKDGRLSPEQAEAVGDAVLRAPDSVFLPDFQKCPEESTQITNLPGRLGELQTLIEKRLQDLCLNRRHGGREGGPGR